MRTIPSLGNYDYVIDWVLTESGAIRIDVGATGIDAVKGVAARTMADPSAAQTPPTACWSRRTWSAVNHDHFLSFRLDLDIDGPENTLIGQRLEPAAAPDRRRRRSLWRVSEQPVAAEGPLGRGRTHRDGGLAHRQPEPDQPRWASIPATSCARDIRRPRCSRPDDIVQRRAAFSAAPLWITAYDRRELYAAGTYPNQSTGGDGLPAYAARHRPVENADIVLWYTMGFHHLTRPEDWPVMNTVWHSVSLVPYGFFDRNPGIDRASAN